MTLTRPLQWLLLGGASLLSSILLQRGGLPGALLLGPMLCGVAFGVGGSTVRVPRLVFVGAQGILGCMIAHAVTADIVLRVAHDWATMLGIVLTTVAAAGLVSFAMMRFGSLPGTVPAWGLSPGAASAMIGMAEDHGADPRLVAFMQYFRAVSVVLCLSVMTLFIADPHPPAVPAGEPSGGWAAVGPVAATLVLAFGGAWLGTALRLPSGGLLGPMLIGSVLHATGLLDVILPPALLAVAYAAIGLYVGLRFTREVIGLAARALPEIAAATFVLIGLGALSAWLLTRLVAVDFLTAFLATSPGGLDSVAIIAAGAPVDLPFILALQTLRLFFVTLASPLIARVIARTARPGLARRGRDQRGRDQRG